MTIDDLNTDAHQYSTQLTKDWRFTGWKPAQGTTGLLGQWLSKNYQQEIQVGPLYPPYTREEEEDCFKLSRELLDAALQRGPAPENRPELILIIRGDDPDYDTLKERATRFQRSSRTN